MLIAGFDAGQTHTRCRLELWDPDRPPAPLGEGEGSGVCHLDAPEGSKRFEDAIRSSLVAALAQANLPLNSPIAAAVVGASGIEQGTDLQARGQALLGRLLGLQPDQSLVTGDERTALHGAFPASAGLVLISGTGMICVGRDDAGREQRSGGWGWRLDGGGSAFDIGHQGLQLSLRMADGRLPETPLRQRLWTALNCHSPAQVKALAAGPGLGVADLARLAPLVHAQAEAGDKLALEVLRHSAAALGEAAAAVSRALKLEATAISPHGGAITHLTLFRQLVGEQLDQRLPRWHWSAARGTACDGALSLARCLIKPR